MKIISGKQPSPIKAVVYGPEGIGKSTFASQFPKPLFIDTEGGTHNLDVDRTETPSSWSSLIGMLDAILRDSMGYKTLVIDSADWAEELCIQHICAKSQKEGIEDFGYGKGYVYLAEEFGRFLNKLSDIHGQGMHVVLTAHAQLKRVELPEETGSYDHWEMKLEKKTGPLVKEWSSLLLFAHYKILVVETDKDGPKKAQGGQRIMNTEHTPWWDAKNRYGLPAELPFTSKSIAHIFTNGSASKSEPQKQEETTGSKPDEKTEPKVEPKQELLKSSQYAFNAKLYQLMDTNGVTEEEIKEAVASKGYYPLQTPIHNYDEDFVDGVLVAAWSQVFEMIKSNRKEKAV